MANEQISEITTVPTNATVIKIINALIKRYNSLGSIYTFKGSVQTYGDLLIIQNPNVGDVYNVIEEDAEHQVAAGSNFVWDGTVWDNLGGSLAGLVQSVNGINPDSLGNVLLPLIKNISTNRGTLTITRNNNSTEQFNNIKKLYMLTLGENINLNDLTESGIYICASNAYAANYENCPIQKAFLLEVQATVAGNFIFQFLTQYNDGSTEAGNQYIRTCYNNNWSVWRMAGSGSNLTTYTSLEQIGITPGQETFASIHNALPINSVLEYTKSNLNTYNEDFYPASYGLFRATKLSSSLTFFEYLQYIAEIRSGSGADNTNSNNICMTWANICMIWATTYNSRYPNRVMTWNKSLSTETEAQQIVRSKIRVNSPTNWSQYTISTASGYYRALEADDSRIRLDVRDTTDGNERRYLEVYSKTGQSSLLSALMLVNVDGGAYNSYRVYGQHNLATQAEAEAGTENNKPMTPLRVKQAIAALAGKITWTISKGTNGWARESSTGFTIQWGYGRDSRYGNGGHDEHSNVVVTLPRAFTTVYGIWAGNVGSTGKYSCYVWNITKTKFNMGGSNNSDGRALPYWWAVGIS